MMDIGFKGRRFGSIGGAVAGNYAGTGTSTSISSLFAGAKPFNEKDNSTLSNDVQNTLTETRDALLDRGIKLENAAEKSAQLADAAGGFAEMAKQLNKQQQSRWF